MVAFVERNNLKITCHTLIWHLQTPDWVIEDDQGNPIGRDALIERILREVFLYNFKKVVQDSKAISVMATFNEIDGSSCHART